MEIKRNRWKTDNYPPIVIHLYHRPNQGLCGRIISPWLRETKDRTKVTCKTCKCLLSNEKYK